MLSTIAWDGGGDGSRWKDPLNWAGDQLPGAADDVVIDTASDPTVLLEGGASVRSVQSREAIQLAGVASLTVAEASVFHSRVTMMPSSMVTGTGNVEFDDLLDVTSATFLGSGTITVASTGLLRLTGFATIGSPFVVEGATEWTALKTTLYGGVTFTNRGDFVCDSPNIMDVVSSNGTGTFSQEGMFTKLGSGELRFAPTVNTVRFNSTAPLTVEDGVLSVGGLGTHSASMTVEAGGKLSMLGNHALDPGASVSGAGTYEVGQVTIDVPVHVGDFRSVNDSAHIVTTDFSVTGLLTIDGGSLYFDVDTALAHVEFVSGNLDGIADLTVTIHMTWRRGAMGDAGRTLIAPGALLDINSAALLGASRNLVNYGTIDWQAGGFSDNQVQPIDNFGLMLVHPAGTVDGPWIRNSGEFRKQGSGRVSLVRALENTGTLVVEGGLLAVAGGGFTDQPITIDAPGTLAINDTLFTIAPGASITGTGRLEFDGAAHQQVASAVAVHEMVISGFVEFLGAVSTETGFHMHGGEASFRDTVDFGVSQPLDFSGIADLGANDLAFSTGHVQGTITTSGLLEFSADVTWVHGEILGGGLLRIPTGVTLFMVDDFKRELGVTLENHGVMEWDANQLVLHDVTIDSDGLIVCNVIGTAEHRGAGRVINRGSIHKRGPGSVSLGRRPDAVVFENLGEVVVDEGTVFVNESTNFNDANGEVAGGRWLVSGFATIIFGFDADVTSVGADTTLSVVGENSRVWGIGALANVAGTLELLDRAELAAAPAGGTFTQSGTIRLDAGSLLTIAGSLVQAASANSLVEFQSSHPLLGFGRLIADAIAVDGGFTAIAINGYMPPEGSMHRFMQAASVSGRFASTTLPEPSAGNKWGVRYDVDGVTLIHTDLTDMDLNGIVDTRDFLVYLNLWASDDPGADTNGDGNVDVLDFLFWLNAWNDG